MTRERYDCELDGEVGKTIVVEAVKGNVSFLLIIGSSTEGIVMIWNKLFKHLANTLCMCSKAHVKHCRWYVFFISIVGDLESGVVGRSTVLGCW